ncbi:hypothetical protein DH2020_023207 [Rehmannia glutinosa]|uniref:Homeobox-leucine zipper protein n=1 Tax=Rehmannia glutinosa TaxID=99300 RepID=A0ABR0W958_REHGL
MEGQGELGRIGENYETSNVGGIRRSRDEENESRSGGSDNMEGGSGDDQDASDKPPRKKRYHRHTPQQIQELEAVDFLFFYWFFNSLFKECPHPDEKQRLELSKRLCLETRQVKFWFQNRRTQMKTQLERHENSILRQENDKLRAENMSIKDAMRNPICTNCGPPDFGGPLPVMPSTKSTMNNMTPIERSLERSMYLELALAAMDELVKMAQTDEPIWLRSLEGGEKPQEKVVWLSSTVWRCRDVNGLDVISDGMGGTRNGALQLMHAELQVLSPLVPVREVNFLRFCKQHAEGVWAVVDVSIDAIRETSSSGSPTYPSCRRLLLAVWYRICLTAIPSSILVFFTFIESLQVTWVEHAEYDESLVHQLYRPLIGAGMGFGAQRWVATLQRQSECLAILMSSNTPARDHTAITAGGRRSMLKLAQRMTNNFCAGVCASTVHKWNKLRTENVDEDVRVMTRKSVDDPGEPPGIVLSAATSVWLPVSPQRLFDFLRNEHLRSEWDILSNGGPMQEMAHIAKGQDHGNCVSLLRASAMHSNQSSMLILQETCIDAAGSLVVYAPVDIPAMHVVMNGGDSAYVALLPSGFAIVPDGPMGDGPSSNGGPPAHRVGGSLLTVAFQILVNSLPTAKLTVESVETVNNLISCTVQKIKAALQCES